MPCILAAAKDRRKTLKYSKREYKKEEDKEYVFRHTRFMSSAFRHALHIYPEQIM